MNRFFIFHNFTAWIIFRLFWFILEVIIAYHLIVTVLNLWLNFMDKPTITTLENPYLPISYVPFPGIAICSNNKLSYWRSKKFAKEFSQISNTTEETILEHVRLLGKLYDFQYSSEHQQKMVYFQSLLDKYDFKDELGYFDVYRRLENVYALKF